MCDKVLICVRLIFFLCFPLFVGCKDDVKSSFPEVIELTSEQKETGDIYMRYPFRVCLDDSSLYVMDLHATDYYCHQFSYPSMAYRQSFIKRGNAPEEFSSIAGIRLDEEFCLWALNPNAEVLIGFDEENDSFHRVEEIKLTDSLIHSLDFDFYNDSLFIIPDYRGLYRFNIVNREGNIIAEKSKIPAKEHTNVPDVALAQAWRSFISYNPSNRILALATQLGEVLEIYDMERDATVNVVRGEAGEPRFNSANGYAIPTGIMGYSDVYVGKENIYAIFWGHSFADLNKGNVKQEGGRYIRVFDLKGNPVREYILDRYITGFSVDEKNRRIIGLDVNSDQPIAEYTF